MKWLCRILKATGFEKLLHNGLRLMAGGFYKRLVCSRLTLGAVMRSPYFFVLVFN
jgi:hypothetical protein